MTTNEKRFHIDISYTTFVRAAVLVIGAAFLFLVRELLFLLFMAIVVSSALDPLVNRLQRRRIPRALTVLVVYVLVAGLFVTIIGLLLPSVVQQAQALVETVPTYVEDVSGWLSALLNVSSQEVLRSDVVDSFSQSVGSTLSGVTDAVSNTVRGVFSFLIVLVLAFYFSVQEGSVKAFVRSIVPEKHKLYVEDLTERTQKQMGLWLRGQLILGLILFVLTYVVLTLLGVPNALVLALLAGVLEIVPYIGPVLAAIPAGLIALTVSPWMALVVLIVYVVLQQIENHVLQPRIMGKVLGLNPLVVIIAILIGVQLAGTLGAILAVPLATALSVFLGDVFTDRETLDERLASRGSREVRFFKPKAGASGSGGKKDV